MVKFFIKSVVHNNGNISFRVFRDDRLLAESISFLSLAYELIDSYVRLFTIRDKIFIKLD